MSNVDLARLQFAMTSIYYFLFVPLTIGRSFLTALLQTSWYRTTPRDVEEAPEPGRRGHIRSNLVPAIF